ncbi:hypothetical protein HYE66_01830 [Aggregatibacter actinomycetemcomitans]|nr:hypothetical protein [Aggregatibacter actinomycetemcomitans]
MMMNLKNNIAEKLVYIYTIKGQFHIYFDTQDNNFYKIRVDDNKVHTPTIIFLILIANAAHRLIGKYVPDTAFFYYFIFMVIGYYIAKYTIKRINDSLFKNNLIYLDKKEFIDNFLFQAIKKSKLSNLIYYTTIFIFLFLSIYFFIYYETYALFLLSAIEFSILLMLETKPYKRSVILQSLMPEDHNN